MQVVGKDDMVNVVDFMEIVSGDGLTFPEKSFYNYICGALGDEFAVNKTGKTISDETGIAKSTIQKYLKALDYNGYIIRTNKGIAPIRHIDKIYLNEKIKKGIIEILNEKIKQGENNSRKLTELKKDVVSDKVETKEGRC